MIPQAEMIKKLHAEALQISQNYKNLEGQLLDLLQKLDHHKVHYKMGYKSLFEYCTTCLNLSESTSYSLINVARKSKKVPELKKEIQKGTITLSKAKKITSVIKPENKDQWLELAKTATQNQIEKEVAKVSPKLTLSQELRYIHESKEVKEKVQINKSSPTRVQLQLGISEKVMLKIRRAQDLLSQKRQRPTDLESVLDEVLSFYLEKKDPVEKAKGKLSRKDVNMKDKSVRDSTSTRMERPNSKSVGVKKSVLKNRKPLPAKTKHLLYLKAKGQCTHVNFQGERCKEMRFLDIHHIFPKSKGGGDHLGNLTLLCRGHHRMVHEQKI